VQCKAQYPNGGRGRGGADAKHVQVFGQDVRFRTMVMVEKRAKAVSKDMALPLSLQQQHLTLSATRSSVAAATLVARPDTDPECSYPDAVAEVEPGIAIQDHNSLNCLSLIPHTWGGSSPA